MYTLYKSIKKQGLEQLTLTALHKI